MKNIILFMFLLYTWNFSAQNQFSFSNIPDSLKKNANYIIWEDFKEFDVIDIGSAVEKVRMAVCIVDQYSKRYNTIAAPYRKNEKVSGFKAEIYDVDGNFVKKLKINEIQDVSAVSDFSLFEDDRILYANFIHGQYPYTLVYEYEKKVDGLLHYPIWDFQKLENTGVISSQLNLIMPNSMQFKYKEFNLSQPVKISEPGRKKQFTWSEQNLKPVENPELMPPAISSEHLLYLAPVQFAEGGYEGIMDSWENLGKWILKLNKDRFILPETKVNELRSMVKDAKSDKEKIEILYKYMQDKTRYVSVQLGIGGYQPFSAEYVDSKGYGDCKALSNYMYSLLKAVGIPSHYVLVSAGEGEDDIITDFPSSQFNHIILCVPQPKDTIWLECTNQQQPFNFLGSFTEDRHVLLITENGGKLVKTPRYGKKINTQIRIANLKIGADGNANGNVNTIFNGMYFENRIDLINQSAKEQKDALKTDYTIAGLEFESFKFVVNKNEIPNIQEYLDVNIQGFAPVTNKRMFVKLNVFNESGFVPKNEERKIPFKLDYEYINVDSILIEIPDGYIVESMPQPIKIETKFGYYQTTTNQKENQIIYIRTYVTEKGIFSTADYKAYYDYRKQTVKADKAKLVFVKKA